MKIYTREQKDQAKAKLPKPILEFLGSQTLTNLYIGIQRKLKLNLRHLMMFSEIVNVTLMGLEDEHALETNLHQWLPELSNEATRELAADINDRIFKEANRRLQQNIMEPEPKWDEEELGPKENLTGPVLSDIELDKLAEQQEKEKWQPPVDPTEGPEGDIPESTDEDEKPTTSRTETIPAGNIALQKLSAPTVTKAQDVIVTTHEVGIQQITVPQPPAKTQQPSASAPATKTYPGGTDPYREIAE